MTDKIPKFCQEQSTGPIKPEPLDSIQDVSGCPDVDGDWSTVLDVMLDLFR
jgi:hypothetical protein